MLKKILLGISLTAFLSIMIGIPIAHANLGGAFSAPAASLTGLASGSSGSPTISFAATGSTGIFTNGSGLLVLEGNASTVSIGNGVIQTSLTLQGAAIQGSAGTFSGGLTLNTSTTDITTGTNEDLTLAPNGTGTLDITKHFKGKNAQASSNSGSGSCTAVTVSGTDIRGTITATCTAAQTVIMNYGATFGTAPICVISPANAAADAVGSGSAFLASSTSALTMTVPTAATAGIWNYQCIE
jgi:hypothetical protein